MLRNDCRAEVFSPAIISVKLSAPPRTAANLSDIRLSWHLASLGLAGPGDLDVEQAQEEEHCCKLSVFIHLHQTQDQKNYYHVESPVDEPREVATAAGATNKQ